jgi:hypothetical protein
MCTVNASSIMQMFAEQFEVLSGGCVAPHRVGRHMVLHYLSSSFIGT